MKMGSSAAGCQLQTLHSCDILVWLPAQQWQCRKQNKGWDSKTIFTFFVLELSLSLTTLWCFSRLRTLDSNSVWSSHGLFSVGRSTWKHKMFWLATITTSQLLFLLLFVIWNTLIHHCISLRLRLFLAFESQLWCLIAHNNNPTLILIITH